MHELLTALIDQFIHRDKTGKPYFIFSELPKWMRKAANRRMIEKIRLHRIAEEVVNR